MNSGRDERNGTRINWKFDPCWVDSPCVTNLAICSCRGAALYGTVQVLVNTAPSGNNSKKGMTGPACSVESTLEMLDLADTFGV